MARAAHFMGRKTLTDSSRHYSISECRCIQIAWREAVALLELPEAGRQPKCSVPKRKARDARSTSACCAAAAEQHRQQRGQTEPRSHPADLLRCAIGNDESTRCGTHCAA